MYMQMYLQLTSTAECFITHNTVIWMLPIMYILMYLQTTLVIEYFITHSTGICMFHSM